MLMKALRLLLRLPLLLLHLLVALPITLMASIPPLPRIRLFGRPLDVIMESWWTATACRIFGLRIEISGLVENTPSLVVANHISWLDVPLLYSVAPMGFVSKAEVDRWPVLGFIARHGHTLFHDRGCHDSARTVLAAMIARLQRGERVTIFPEGGILDGEHIKPFHARMFAAAADSGAPVQPMMLRYVKDGRHYRDIRFRPGEGFIANFFRLLTQPSRLAEVAILQPLPSAGRPRKELANTACAAVAEAYDEGLLR